MRLGIIGYGNMGSSFAKALKDKAHVLVYDISEEKRRKALEEGFGVAKEIEFLLEGSDWLFLAVKPKEVPKVLSFIREGLKDKILISTVAGLSLKRLEELSNTKRLIRIMPNINALVGRAVIAYAFGEGVSEEEKKTFLSLFSSCGSLFELDEPMFDSFTALAGSGPAFVFKFIHALALAGVKEGFPYETAKAIAIHTVLGSCELLKELGGHPEEWIVKVASPGGTTIEGIKVLEEKGFAGIIMECIRQTSEKAKRLS